MLENLVAAVEALKATKELEQKQTQLAQDQQSLSQQLAELEGRRRNLASAPTSSESPAQPFVAASSALPSLPAAGMAAFPAGAPPPSAIALGSATPVLDAATPARTYLARRSLASAAEAGPSPRGATPDLSDVTRAGSAPTSKGRTSPAIRASGSSRPNAKDFAGSAAPADRVVKGNLAELLRRRLAAADGDSLPESDANANPGTAAESAIASLLHGEVSAGGPAAAGEARQVPDFSGLSPLGTRENPSSEFPARESLGLFERVHSAHQRFEEHSATRRGRAASL